MSNTNETKNDWRFPFEISKDHESITKSAVKFD